MRMKECAAETAAALRERYKREMLSPQEVAECCGISRNIVVQRFDGWVGGGDGQRIAVEVLARQMVG